MRKSKTIYARSRTLLLGGAALLLILSLSPTQAGTPPFDVRRGTTPALVASGPSYITVAIGPFDDTPGTLTDNQTYFYLIEDLAAQPVALSVHKNIALNTVRIGFNDDDAFSAPVHAANSSVTVAPASVPANGLSVIEVMIVPRDADGLLLGAGLDLQIDAGPLQPGVINGPISDLGNGVYTVGIVSSTPGYADVSVSVEGLWLQVEPAITYEFVGPSICGDGITDPANGEACDDGNGNNFDDCRNDCQAWPEAAPDALQLAIDDLEILIDDPSMSGDIDDKLDSAIEKLEQATDELNRVPPRIENALNKIEDAIKKLLDAVEKGLDLAIAEPIMERLTAISRALAVQAIDDAIAAGADPDDIANALDAVDDGDLARAAGEYEDAVGAYKDAAGSV
jgi:hypothetical protein